MIGCPKSIIQIIDYNYVYISLYIMGWIYFEVVVDRYKFLGNGRG